ncbi:hypothetical protein Q8F55_007727 [Vanrija albida]|uniref:DinB-like domain-containing protein n=1 Tax=Vanrija albida TaxID=181172 RepID=A0ABR3PUB4_9TREE
MSQRRLPALDHKHTPAAPYSNHRDAAHALQEVAISLIDSGLRILQSDILTDEQLQHESVLIPGGSLGKHFRHVTEMFDAFLLPLSTTTTAGGPLVIDYDAELPRSRHLTARSVSHARQAMEGVRTGLAALGNVGDLASLLGGEVEVVALTPSRQELNSTLGRELWFCSLHAIHHYTMIRTIAVHELGLSLSPDFGTAPATLLYRSRPSEPADKVWAKL